MSKVSVAEVIDKVKETLGEVNPKVDLITLFNLVETELVSEVIKLTDTFVTKVGPDCEVLVSSFPKKLLSVIDIYYDSKKVGWGYLLENPHDSIGVPGHGDKEVTIEYHYLPEFKDDDQESDLPPELMDILVYGVITEYFLVMGDFEKASWYNRKYNKNLYAKKNSKKLLKKWKNFSNKIYNEV